MANHEKLVDRKATVPAIGVTEALRILRAFGPRLEAALQRPFLENWDSVKNVLRCADGRWLAEHFFGLDPSYANKLESGKRTPGRSLVRLVAVTVALLPDLPRGAYHSDTTRELRGLIRGSVWRRP